MLIRTVGRRTPPEATSSTYYTQPGWVKFTSYIEKQRRVLGKNTKCPSS